MLYTLRGIRRGFWTAFPANQLVLPLPADVITSNALHHTTEDETDDVRAFAREMIICPLFNPTRVCVLRRSETTTTGVR
jgi:hypothetical protein